MHAVRHPPERLVQRLRLHWPATLPPPAELTWRSRAEDALRTASTAERSRVVFVRRVALQLPAADAGTAAARVLHAPLERALQAAVEQAVPAGQADPARAQAVWFADWDAAVGHLLTRWLDEPGRATPRAEAVRSGAVGGVDWVTVAIARGLPTQLSLDAASMDLGRPAVTRVATVWSVWLQTATSAHAAAAWALARWQVDPRGQLPWLHEAVRRVRLPDAVTDGPAGASPRAGRAAAERLVAVLHLMVGRGRSEGQQAFASVAGTSMAGGASEAAAMPPAARAARTSSARIGRLRFDAGSTAAPIDAREARAEDGSLATATTLAPGRRPAGRPRCLRTEFDDQPIIPGDGLPGGPARVSTPGVDGRNGPASEPLWASGELVVTQLGGLALLLNLLMRLGFGDWLDTQPVERQRTLAMAPFHVVLATAGRRGAVESAWEEALAAPHGDADSAADGRAWLRRSGRAARAWGCATLGGLLWRRAGLVLTPTHLDLVFRLDQVDLALRRAALDADPGWVPWFGRIVSLHFEAGDPWQAGPP